MAKIYAESDLLLTETIKDGILDSLTAPELVAVVSAMIYESRGAENLAPKMPHQNVASALASITAIWAHLESIEEDFGVQTQREPDFGFAFASFKWASGHGLSQVLRGSDMTVGDFVRSIKQLIDLLNQIGVASENLRPRCREAIKKIDRGVVSYMVSDL